MTRLKVPYDTTANLTTGVVQEREIAYDSTLDRLIYGDGVSAAGVPVARYDEAAKLSTSLFTSGDSTPSVLSGSTFITAGSTAITDFDDATAGQVITIVRGSADITITYNASKITTVDGNDVLLTAANPSITFRDNNGVWSEVSRAQPVGFWFTLEGFGAAGDGVTDDLPALLLARTTCETLGIPMSIRLKHGAIYRLSDEGALDDMTVPIIIEGPGQYTCGFYGDFTGASKAVLNIGFTTDAARVDGHELRGFAIWANGVAGDPMGINNKAAQSCTIERVFIPGVGTSVLGATRKLYNIGIFATKVNNSQYRYCHLACGYQPAGPYTLPTSATFSMTSGSAMLTSSVANTFSAGMVGETVLLTDGAASSDSQDYYTDTIAAYVDTQNVTLTNTAPETFSGANASIGILKGSISSGGTTLTVNASVLTSAHAGYRIFIPGAWSNSDASNKKGLLCTYIVSVTNSATFEVADAADATVSNVPIYFAPSAFIGTAREEQGDSRSTNDCKVSDFQVEGRAAPVGIILQNPLDVHIESTKIELAAVGSGNNFGFQQRALIISAPRDVSYSGSMNWGWSTTAQVHILGGRGCVRFYDWSTSGIAKNARVFEIDSENTSAIKLDIDSGRCIEGTSRHSAGWAPALVPSTLLDSASYSGEFTDRVSGRRWGRPKLHPGYKSGRYYWGDGLTPGTPSAAQTADRIYVFPIRIHERVSIASLAAKVSNGVAATNVRLAIYENNPITASSGSARPGKVLMYTASTATTSSGDISASVTAIASILEPGIYWMACHVDGAAEMRSITTANYTIAAMQGGGTADQLFANSGQSLGFIATATYASGIPTDLSSTGLTAVTSQTVPIVAFITS